MKFLDDCRSQELANLQGTGLAWQNLGSSSAVSFETVSSTGSSDGRRASLLEIPASADWWSTC